MREAGLNVAEAASPEEAVQLTRDASPALVLRDGHLPAFHVPSAPDSACGETGGQIEIVLPQPAEPVALVEVACALLRLRAAGASFRVSGARQTGGSVQAAVKSLCHDLRTPLSAMAGRLYLMENGGLGEPDLKRAIEKLQGNINDQVQLIDRVLLALPVEPE